MAKALNFNTVKKRYWSVTLADDKHTTLLIGMPTKAIMAQLLEIHDRVKEAEGGDLSLELLEDMYAVCAAVMSRNKAGVRVEQSYLENLFDTDDIQLFFESYIEFVGEETNEKN